MSDDTLNVTLVKIEAGKYRVLLDVSHVECKLCLRVLERRSQQS